jgi:hypothetical protein
VVEWLKGWGDEVASCKYEDVARGGWRVRRFEVCVEEGEFLELMILVLN